MAVYEALLTTQDKYSYFKAITSQYRLN